MIVTGGLFFVASESWYSRASWTTLTGRWTAPADRIDGLRPANQNCGDRSWDELAIQNAGRASGGVRVKRQIRKYICFLALTALAVVCGCGAGANSSTASPVGPTQNPSSPVPAAKSAKRGVAYDLADPADFAALSPGVSWWYNW